MEVSLAIRRSMSNDGHGEFIIVKWADNAGPRGSGAGARRLRYCHPLYVAYVRKSDLYLNIIDFRPGIRYEACIPL